MQHVTHHHLSPAQRRWRRVRRGVVMLVGLALIMAAAAIGGLALAMPWLVAHPDRVQAYLTQKLGRPVKFAHATASFQRSGPLLTLDQVEIDDPAGKAAPFKIAHAELAVDVYAFLERYGSFTEFVLEGLDIDATYGADGHWRVERFGSADTTEGDQSTLLDLVAVSLRNSRLTLHHEKRGETLKLARVDLRLVNNGGERQFGGLLRTVADGAPLRVACSVSDEFQRGGCYLGGKQLEVSQWLIQLPLIGVDALAGSLDLGVWADWDHGPAAVRVEAQAHEWVLRGTTPVPIGRGESIEPRAHFEDLGMAARWQRNADGWRLDAKGWRGAETDATSTSIALQATDFDGGRRYALDAPRVALDDWLPVIAVAHGLPDGIRGWMFQAAPRGQLLGLSARWDSSGAMDADAQLSGLAFGAARLAPGVETIDGRLIADERALVLIASPDRDIRVDFPHVFRTPVDFKLHSATLAALRDDDGSLRFEATDLDLAGDAISAHGRASWDAPQDGTSSPVLDVTLGLERGKIALAHQFWPVNVMPPGTVAFLDRSLVSGEITGGNVVFYGPVEDFAFDEKLSGRFDARATVHNVDFDFHKDWPRAHIDTAELAFVNNSMDILAESSSMKGNEAGPAHAHIERLNEPDLQLEVKGSGSGKDMLALIRSSPIKQKVGEFIEGLELGGKGEIAFNLLMPLGDHSKDRLPTLNGTVRLADGRISNPVWGVAFEHANGEFKFSDRGLMTKGLNATWNQLPAVVAFESGEFVSDHRHDIAVHLSGEWPATQIFGGVPVLAAPLAKIEGRSHWLLEFLVDAPSASGARGKHLLIESDLKGTKLDLPAPLAKAADTALPLELALDYPMTGSPIDLKLGDLARLRGRLESTTQPFAGVLLFGPGEPGPAPEVGLRVRGVAPSLDLAEWAALGGGPGSGGALGEVDLAVNALKLSGRDFGETHVNLADAAGESKLSFAGKSLEGAVSWNSAALAQRGLSARFERLLIPSAPPGAAPGPQTDPSKFPPLHLWAKDFRIGTAQLGETRLESYPKGDGMHVEHFETRSENLELRAQGDWTLTQGAEKSAFDISFTAPDLGKLLDALGFSGMVADGPTYAHVNGWWEGAPGDVALPKINGSLEGKVGAGRILEVDPGAGRFFGLINLQAIPRRLSLDFSDFFKAGMSFDSIEGKFTLSDGDAHTTDVVLSAPSAQIHISGRTGLAKRDYDQELDVQPKVAGVLPWVGAIAGGPAGAAAGLVVQNILSKPIKSASRARYHVTGTWENPEITLIARDKDRAALKSTEKPR